MVCSQVRTQQRTNITWNGTSPLGGLSKVSHKRIRIIVGKERQQRSADQTIVLVAPYSDCATLAIYLASFIAKPLLLLGYLKINVIYLCCFLLIMCKP